MFLKNTLPREKGDITCYGYAPGKRGNEKIVLFAMFTKKKFVIEGKYSNWPISPFVQGDIKAFCIWNVSIGFAKARP